MGGATLVWAGSERLEFSDAFSWLWSDRGVFGMVKPVRKVHYGCLLAVGGVAAALYLNSLWGEFVFDDHEAIENNPDVR